MTATAAMLPLTHALHSAEAGGKARNLSRVIQSGHPVPDGIVVTNTALASFLDYYALETRIEAACATLDVGAPATVRTASDRIAALFRERPLPPALHDAIAASLAAALLSGSPEPLIVRSSAMGEDANDASFAGQLDSIGGVRGMAALDRAIRDVWASRWSARSLTYQLARGKRLAGMGVILQRQIEATVSGVIFTVTPGDEDTMTIEYCGGAGEALVSGRIDPGRIVVDRRTLTWIRVAAPGVATPAEDAFVRDSHVDALARRALAIERDFAAPQDIEWTMDGGGTVWIVQARPITVAARATTTTARRVFWSNANVNENFPQPISPLLYSIARKGYYHYFRNLGLAFGVSTRRVNEMERPLRQIIGVHGARMYYNLTSIHGVLRSAPFGDHLAAWFNRFVGAEDTDTPAAAAIETSRSVTARLVQSFELARIALSTAWQYLSVTARVARFERTVVEFAARTHPDGLPQRSRLELAGDLRAFLDIRCHRWIDASLADTAAMVCYGALERVLRRAFPADDQAALHNSLLKALPGLPSGLPAVKLWELSREVRDDRRLRHLVETRSAADALDAIRRQPEFHAFAGSFDRFLDEWGFRCSGELLLTVKSFQEDPAALLEIVKAYVAADGSSPKDHLEAQRAERLRDTERVAAVLRRRRLLRVVPMLHQWHAVSILLRWTQHSILLRERARLKQALLYTRLRRVALALGDRFVSSGAFERADDVFMLTVEELDDLATGSEMFPHHVRALIAHRRQAHADASAMTPADSFTLSEGEYLPMAAKRSWPERPGRTASSVAEVGPGSSSELGLELGFEFNGELTGLGVCGGTASARAAVLSDVTQSHRLRRGDILVTRQTDPGWGAVFPLISGLVMERGGMLSHGAIIAREFGIPSVVGIANATTLVRHGDRIHVNGDLGTLRIERDADRASVEARAS
jgi:phosphohistidine swiveling domain-containing protein